MNSNEPQITDLQLEQLALEELPASEMEALQERVASDPGLTARLQRIRASNEELLQKYPPDQMQRFIAARTVFESTTDDGEKTAHPTLPMRLQVRAIRHLRLGTLVIGTLALLGMIGHVSIRHILGWNPTAANVVITSDAVVVFMSLGLWAAARSGRFQPLTLLNVGQLYQVFVCFAVSVAELSLGRELGMGPVGLSFVCVLLVVFPIYIPPPGRIAAVTAIVAASTGPLAAILDTWLVGSPVIPLEMLGGRYIFNYLTVILVGIPVAMVRRHGRDVRRANRMGSYQLQELLGRGGMGEVWRASHHTLRRPAAIKLIRPESLGPGANIDRVLRRFEREAQATAELHSHHTIDLYDFGTAEDGRFFYVMELLDGFDLDTLVTRFGPLPAERVVHILTQACDSLDDAHSSGLIHRDIKPANLYVCRYGKRADFVKVLDFGMVKVDDSDAADVKLTRGDGIAGTPAFLAPEMAAGDTTIDGRADLYALGCVGYWLLTGQLVFDEKHPLKMAMAHMRETPEPPSARTELEVPAALEAVLLRCLAKDPAERPASAADLAAELTAALPSPTWSAERAERWWQTNVPDVG